MNRLSSMILLRSSRRVPQWLNKTHINPALSESSERLYSSNVSSKTAANTDMISNLYEHVSTSSPVLQMQQYLIQIHDYTGLPWWASIILSTVIFRSVVTLPLTIYQHTIVARLEKIKLELPEIASKLRREVSLVQVELKWSDIESKSVYERTLKTEWDKLIVRENCHPAKTVIVLWAQIPLWICLSMSIRNMIHMLPDPASAQAGIVFAQLTLGGFGWIPNLTEVDSSYILPVALGLINLCIIELQSLSRAHETTRFQQIVSNCFRGGCFLMVPIACSVPSALSLYWMTSSAYGLLQNLLLLSPSLRRALRIPKSASELESPYVYILSRLKNRQEYIINIFSKIRKKP